MAQASPPSSKSTITPQATGFSQVHTRGGGEGGGQAMSVLLSWHEKVRPRNFYIKPNIWVSKPNLSLYTNTITACRNSWPWLGREGHDRPAHCLSKRCNDRPPADEHPSVPEIDQLLAPGPCCSDIRTRSTNTLPSQLSLQVLISPYYRI
jgi:hypothetical protein